MKKRIYWWVLILAWIVLILITRSNSSTSDEITIISGQGDGDAITGTQLDAEAVTGELGELEEDENERSAEDQNTKNIIANLRKNREKNVDLCDDIKCDLGSICIEGICELLEYKEPEGICGNFVVDEAEVCDRWTLCTDTCECPNWLIWCEWGCAEPGYCMPKLCGNDVVNEAEECDGWDLCTQYCECPEWLIWCEGGCAQAGYCK